ncbi:biotin/lipoyl-containing protein [Georgenia sp. SYP-B2076]|uniref:acetyl-CoA carboxylase biotin carboxyl carrier protein n=1 Tax=Georgenia sp. SYP-B2076 TaxID=2495881 RepID=UPI000F8D727A|nr:biotin/lipoyl-containing protein [Georgenia sp. SYP-B2076]
MDVDLEELAAIIEQLDKTEFTEFLYENGPLRIHVRRGLLAPLEESPGNGRTAEHPSGPGGAAPERAARSHEGHADAGYAVAPEQPRGGRSAAAAPAPAAAAPAPRDAVSPDALPPGHVLVKAPMLGTFYRAPKPGEAAFAEQGETVAADSVVCIIEVMKLMNSVPAGVAGELVAVYASDGDLVEFDQPLFAIREAS